MGAVQDDFPASSQVGTDIPDRGVPTADRPFPRPGAISDDELVVRFTYHPPRGDQLPRFSDIRAQAHALAQRIVETTPGCREQSLAITAIEEAVMWANAAIARRES